MPNCPSYEVRWFFKEAPLALTQRFGQKGFHFTPSPHYELTFIFHHKRKKA